MTDWQDRLDAQQRSAPGRSRMSCWRQPRLTTLTVKRFSSPDWVFKRELDGERCLVFRRKRLGGLTRKTCPSAGTPGGVRVIAVI